MRKRNVTITIRCMEDERQRIRTRAEQHGLKLSDFVLRSALGKKIVLVEGLPEVMREQKAIGRNLNQIAMLAHEGRLRVVHLDGLLEQNRQVTTTLCEIAKAVK